MVDIPESVIKTVQESVKKGLESIEKDLEEMFDTLENSGFVSYIAVDIGINKFKELRDEAKFLTSYYNEMLKTEFADDDIDR